MRFEIPQLSLVVLIGVSGSGKSTFARKHFLSTEVISSDYCRGVVADDENALHATNDAFDVLHYIASKRLAAGRLTVVDATNVQRESRAPLIEIARTYHAVPVAIVLLTPEAVCQERNSTRADRDFGPHVVRNQYRQLKRSLKGLRNEGFRYVFYITDENAADTVEIERTKLWNDKRELHGPFDIIGDVHGCYDELCELLTALGYRVEAGGVEPPDGRMAVFIGDLVDRGPKNAEVLRLVMRMVENGTAICVPGNHDVKLLRALQGRNVQRAHGLAETMEQLAQEPEEFRSAVAKFLDGLISHYVLDEGRLVVAHAGLPSEMQGRASARVRDFCLFGETTGETDEYGLPVRYNWAADYRGRATVVYGHTPVVTATWLNNTICIDTGCAFGGQLSALRWPEREIVSVKAKRTYYEPAGPISADKRGEASRDEDLLDLSDVIGKRIISTRLTGSVMIQAHNSAAALEVMSRFALNPQWLVYLPPTMSPCETSSRDPYLEHPEEAFAYYRDAGITRVVCEEKHMGSRAVVLVCKNEEVASKKFGESRLGVCYTRTGRPFFNDSDLEVEFLRRTVSAISKAGLWADFATDWILLDCELMPWSLKAQELLRKQYAAVGCAASAALGAEISSLCALAGRGLDASELLRKKCEEFEEIQRYVNAYRAYCWPVRSIADVRLAPFHLLATEGVAHVEKSHQWHMEYLGKLSQSEPRMFIATDYRVVNLGDQSQVLSAIEWWNGLTERGSEGIVVKPEMFAPERRVQPAVKCRGREYLRIIYGPHYDRPENLVRLRSRSLGKKRSLAMKEFALGVEGLERFVHHEPLYRVHECAFAVLALESEPVDPRL